MDFTIETKREERKPLKPYFLRALLHRQKVIGESWLGGGENVVVNGWDEETRGPTLDFLFPKVCCSCTVACESSQKKKM